MIRMTRLKRFLSKEHGVLSTEAALVFPLLLWAYLGLFVFFEAFRTQNINVRAAYTISDMLSRETDPVNPSYIEGLNNIFALLTHSQYPTVLRVSGVRYDSINDSNILVWSYVDGGTGVKQPITQGSLSSIEPQIPVMGDGDFSIVVETWAGFVPMLNVGIDAQYFENFVVTRPRFAPQVVWSDT
jgi:hypothetical protein